ncbi:MAG: histidine kinase [Acidobacteriota bacterium]
MPRYTVSNLSVDPFVDSAITPVERARRLRQELELGAPRLHRRWHWAIYFGGWTLIGLLFAAWMVISPALGPALSPTGVAEPKVEFPWSQVLSEMFRWYLWALLAPFMWWLAMRFPLQRQRMASRLAINLVAGIGVTLIYVTLDLIKREVITTMITAWESGQFQLSFQRNWQDLIFWQVEYHILTYFCIVAVIHAYLYYEKFRDRELKSSKLRAQLALARLEVLKTQLHPHFLFNTLNAISALMHRDVEAADRMIALLSDLLRLSLDKDDRHQVSLRSELEFLERYLAIEKIRFRDRLVVDLDIEGQCFDAQVPRLILQPLVENSIRHGIAMRSASGQVAIRARRKGNRLDVTVSDDGPGLVGGKPKREGVGLANTRARLEQIYGGDHRFQLVNGEDCGLIVEMEIPFEVEPRFALAS